MPEPVVGIDLGTTYSLVAYVGAEGPRVLPNPRTGRTLCPSVVRFEPDGSYVVGDEARRGRARHTGSTVYSVKRFMGRGARDLSSADKGVAFRLLENDESIVRIEIHGRSYTPPQISSYVLRELRSWAASHFGFPVAKAVVTVPAYFNDAQRQATRDAGKLAGLEVLRIVNEPTAACLAYGLDGKRNGTVAVYDLGGGTFDVSILRIEDGVFRVLSTNGDTHLGGDDLDEAIASKLLDERPEILATLSPDERRVAWELVRIAAEEAKCRLSLEESATLRVRSATPRVELDRTLTRAEVEGWVEPVLRRTRRPCAAALKDAGLDAGDLDEVVLVGGQTRMPAVRRLVEELFRRPPHVDLNPDEVVALGAAVQASVLAGGTKDLLLLDVTPLSLGIETLGGVMSRLIDRNTTIPVVKKEVYTTGADHQTGIVVHVLQGERELARDCRSLGKLLLKGIAPAVAGIPRIEVTFLLDANGILNVAARDLATGREQSIDIQPSYGLSEEEFERMLRESIEHAQEDVHDRMLAEARVEADAILRECRREIAEQGDLLTAEERAAVEEAVARLQELRERERDYHEVRKAIEALDRLTTPFAQRVMDRAAQRALEGRRLSEV